MRKRQCVCLLIGKVYVCFRVFSQWYRSVRADRHRHILSLYYSSCTRVKCFHCMRSVLTEGQKTCSNSFTPSFLSLSLSLCTLASHVHRRLKSKQKAALQSSQDSEPSWWSFILLFGAQLCPLVLVLCVGMSFICKPMKMLSCRSLLLYGSRQNARVRVHKEVCV